MTQVTARQSLTDDDNSNTLGGGLVASSPHGNVFARRLFNGIARSYEVPAQVLSLFQYHRWHRSLISSLDLAPGARVLEVGTGTGLVAGQLSRKTGCNVVGLDLSDQMLSQARRNLAARGLWPAVQLVEGQAESLPFAGGVFDAVVFTFLLRYVVDPLATLYELARVVKPGGQVAYLEFFVPRGPVWHPLWLAYTRVGLPALGRCLSPAWAETGSFLGPSISRFYRRHSLEDLKHMWRLAGIDRIETRILSVGGAVVMKGERASGDPLGDQGVGGVAV